MYGTTEEFVSGIAVSGDALQTRFREGTPIRFRVSVESPRGKDGAVLSFSLGPTNVGYTPVGLAVGPLTA
jgi:hypothetical protein